MGKWAWPRRCGTFATSVRSASANAWRVVAVAVGAVAHRLRDRDPGIRFRLLDQLQRLLVVLGVARQHRRRRDELALGVDGDGGLVPVEAPLALLRPWRISGSWTETTRSGLTPCWRAAPSAPALDVLQQQPREQVGRLMQPRVLRGVGRAGRALRGHIEQAVGVGDDALQEGGPRRGVVPVDAAAPLRLEPK